MTGRAKATEQNIDQVMEEAAQALTSGRYAEAERLSLEAFNEAHSAFDYERMARILLPLQEARRQRRQQAADVKKLTRLASYSDLEALLTGAKPIHPGCYLIEPLLVAADGRELRERALADDVPVFVLVREPLTRLGQWPIVAVGPVTVRTRVAPPKKPDVSWVLRTGEELGDAALARIESTDSAATRVERLTELLAAIPDHEKIHQALMAACEAAHHEAANRPKKRERPRKIEDDDPFADEEVEAA